MKATKMGTLATALAVIGRESADLESKADTVLRIVRAEKIKEGKQFNKAVRAAYKANGWNVHAGKPKAGAEKLTPVPATVKQYVSAIRAAFRFKLHVTSYSSFYALRQDLAKERAKRKPKTNGRVRPEMAGLTVSRPDILTGGPFHDLVVLYNALDRARRPRMLSALDRVKRDFATAAPQLVMASMPEMRMAA